MPVVAFVWGFAEATFFFFVPDVYTSYVAMTNPMQGLLLCGYSLLGALPGGAILWLWGRYQSTAAQTFLKHIPAIQPKMIAWVRSQVQKQGPRAMFLGPLRGVPYKIYAVQTGALGFRFSTFAVLSLPARGVRFALVTLLFAGLSLLLPEDPSIKHGFHATAWTIFYFIYFHKMR